MAHLAQEENQNQNSLGSGLGLLAVLALGSIIRFYQLGQWSIWIEENHLMRDVQRYMTSFSDIFGNPRPIYYLIVLPIFNWWGVSLTNARAVAAIIGILTLPIFYFFVRRAMNQRIALIATLFLAISPWHLFWSQNARFYTILLLFYAASYTCFYLALETDNFWYTFFAVGFLGAATFSHSIGALLVPLFLIHFAILKFTYKDPPVGLKWRNILPYLLLPIIGYFLYEILRVYFIGTNLFAIDLYNKFFASDTASFIGYANPIIMLTTVLYSVGYPLAILTIYGAFDLIFVQKKRLGLMLAIASYGPLIILMLVALISVSTAKRYVFMSLPFWAILAASGVFRIIQLKNTVVGTVLLLLIGVSFFVDPVLIDIFYFSSRHLMFLLLVAGILLACGAFLYFGPPRKNQSVVGHLLLFLLIIHPVLVDTLYFTFQHGHRDNWQGVVDKIEAEVNSTDIVISHLYPVGRYYLGDDVVPIDLVRDDPTQLAGNTVWLIEEPGAALYLEETYTDWVADSACIEAGDWSNYVAGRTWPMRLLRCSP